MLHPEIKRVLEDLPPDFFGRIEITFRNGRPQIMHTTKQISLTDNKREHPTNDYQDR